MSPAFFGHEPGGARSAEQLGFFDLEFGLIKGRSEPVSPCNIDFHISFMWHEDSKWPVGFVDLKGVLDLVLFLFILTICVPETAVLDLERKRE